VQHIDRATELGMSRARDQQILAGATCAACVEQGQAEIGLDQATRQLRWLDRCDLMRGAGMNETLFSQGLAARRYPVLAAALRPLPVRSSRNMMECANLAAHDHGDS
jgi:hypothetical protein